MLIDLRAHFGGEAAIYHDDPALGPARAYQADEALMGDIVHLPDGTLDIHAEISAGAAIERVDLFNGLDLIETLRPYGEADLGARIRLIWEGAEYRGRFREVIWDGAASFSEAAIRSAHPINFFNPDKRLEQTGARELKWQALTTGNFGGFDVLLDDDRRGALTVSTPLVQFELALAEIGLEDRVFDASGELPRLIRVFRVPETSGARAFRFTRPVALKGGSDNPLFIRVTLEDGTRAWTSPIYVYR
jgi:hypothetical protein